MFHTGPAYPGPKRQALKSTWENPKHAPHLKRPTINPQILLSSLLLRCPWYGRGPSLLLSNSKASPSYRFLTFANKGAVLIGAGFLGKPFFDSIGSRKQPLLTISNYSGPFPVCGFGLGGFCTMGLQPAGSVRKSQDMSTDPGHESGSPSPKPKPANIKATNTVKPLELRGHKSTHRRHVKKGLKHPKGIVSPLPGTSPESAACRRTALGRLRRSHGAQTTAELSPTPRSGKQAP